MKKEKLKNKKLGFLGLIGRFRGGLDKVRKIKEPAPLVSEKNEEIKKRIVGLEEGREVKSKAVLGLAGVYDKISKWAIYLLVFLLPIFFLPWTVNVLDFNKQALLIVLVFVSLLAWMLKVLALGKINLRLTNLHIPIGILFLVFLVSTIFSLWPYGSFWGWPLNSSESLLSLIGLFLLYFLITNIFEKKEVLNLTIVLTISSLAAIIFGILQMFGKFILPWDFTKTASFNTIDSVINRLGLFSAVLFPLLIGLLVQSGTVWRRRNQGWLEVLGKIGIVLILIAIVILLILINFSMVWWVVIVGAGLIMVFGIQRSDFFDGRFLILPMFFLALSLFFIFFRFQVPGLPARPIEVFLTHNMSLDVAKKVIQEKPVLGSGPGTFIYDFSKYKDIDFNQSPLWNVRFDSARSKMLGILATLGILGTLSFIGVIVMFIFYGIKCLFRSDWTQNEWLLSAGIFVSFIALTTGYFLYSSNLTLDFIFFLLMASFIVLLNPTQKEFVLKPSSFLTLSVTFVITLVFIFSLGLLILEGQRYSAEIYYMKGLKAWQTGDIDGSARHLERAVSINPKVDLYWRELSQVYLRKIQEEVRRTDLSRDEINKRVQLFINNAVNSSKMATDVNSSNVANWSVRGFVYSNLIGTASGAREWMERSYEGALKLEPANPYYPTQVGIGLLKEAVFKEEKKEKEELYKKAINQFEKAIELKSDYAPAYFQLARVYQLQGRTAEAIEELEKTKNLRPNDVGLAFQLGLVYYQNKDYQRAETELERAVAISPNYANALYFLGLTYEKQNKRTAAIETFEKLAKLNPDHPQIKKILDNLKAGERALKGIVEEESQSLPIKETPPEIERE